MYAKFAEWKLFLSVPDANIYGLRVHFDVRVSFDNGVAKCFGHEPVFELYVPCVAVMEFAIIADEQDTSAR